jgi:hypothetical protein
MATLSDEEALKPAKAEGTAASTLASERKLLVEYMMNWKTRYRTEMNV